MYPGFVVVHRQNSWDSFNERYDAIHCYFCRAKILKYEFIFRIIYYINLKFFMLAKINGHVTQRQQVYILKIFEYSSLAFAWYIVWLRFQLWEFFTFFCRLALRLQVIKSPYNAMLFGGNDDERRVSCS